MKYRVVFRKNLYDEHYVWYENSDIHREDGAAIEYKYGRRYWYYKNDYVDCQTQSEFEKFLKLKAFW